MSPSRQRLALNLVIVGTAVIAIAEVLVSPPDGPRGALLLFPLGWTLPLLLRDRFPAAAPLAAIAALAIEAQVAYAGTESQVVLVAVIIAFYCLGRNNDLSRAGIAWALGIVLGGILIASDTGPVTGAAVLFLAIITTAPFAAGVLVRARATEAGDLLREAEELRADQDRRAREAVAEERTRIARELHDMVGHAISVITVQAGAARISLDRDPEAAREPLMAIERTGQEAMNEMRRLIGILREMGEPGLAPQPGLDQLPRLVQGVREAGVDVDLRERGAAVAPLSAEVELAAYRTVQEALTNQMKHGADAHVEVVVHHEPDGIALSIESHGSAGGNGDGSGHGLVGMRERVERCDGELEAGELPEGGYAVRVRLPAGTAR